MAHKSGALSTKDLERVAVDTTVQPKAIAFPTDARLLHKAIVMLGKQAKAHGVPLRQSYVRVAKRAALMAGRYRHAKQFKRYNGRLRFLRTRLGRLVRDIRRKTAHDAEQRRALAVPLSRADQIRRQKQRQRGWKLYSWHAPEVECIGKGKARTPYEFGCKVSVTTPVTKPRGGQFVLHAKALHGNPYDGHTLGPVIAETERLTGVEVKRAHVDKGYRGHNHPKKLRVWISGQVRGVTRTIRREMRRRAAVEPVIGHLKAEHRMERNYLKGLRSNRPKARATAQTLSSPPPATTSPCSSDPSKPFCAPGYRYSSDQPSRLRTLENPSAGKLHGRLSNEWHRILSAELLLQRGFERVSHATFCRFSCTCATDRTSCDRAVTQK